MHSPGLQAQLVILDQTPCTRTKGNVTHELPHPQVVDDESLWETGTSVTCEGRLDKEMPAGSCTYSEHIGWIGADVGSLSKVFGLVLNYEQLKEHPLYIQCVWPCWSFLEEGVPFGSLSFQRWIMDTHHCLPSSI